jgi:hypothetical protein
MAYQNLPAQAYIDNGKIIHPVGNVAGIYRIRVKAGTNRPAGAAAEGVFTFQPVTYAGLQPDAQVQLYFDEGAGTVAQDSTVNNKNANFSGATWNANGLTLNGTTGHIHVPAAINTYSYSGAVIMTFTPTVNLPTTAHKRLFVVGDNLAGQNQMDCYLLSTGVMRLILMVNGVAQTIELGTRSFPAGIPVTLVYTWNYYFSRVVINGVQVARQRSKHPILTNAQFIIGAQLTDGGGNTNTLPATINQAAIFNRELSNDAITAWTNKKSTFTPQKQFDKLQPQKGQIILTAPGSGWEAQINAEPTVMKVGNEYRMYFTGGGTPYNTFGIGVATASNPLGPWTKYAGNPVVGGASRAGGTPVNECANCSFVVQKDGVYYMLTTSGSGFSPNSWNGYMYKSTDGLNWSFVVKHLEKTSFPDISGFGNYSVFPELFADGYYYGIVDTRRTSTGVWEPVLIRTQTWESQWEIVQWLPSLQVHATKMYGGPHVLRSADGSKFMQWYHYGGDATLTTTGNLPTRIAYAESTDLINWTILEAPVLGIQDKPSAWPDAQQAADADLFEDGGKTYLFFDYVDNTEPVKDQIRVLSFDGTKEQLANYNS